MGMMIVRHKVRDYGQWRPVFDRHVEMQRAAGLTNPRVYHSADSNKSEIVIVFDTEDTKKAKDFAASADLKEAMKQSGVLDTPTIYFLESIDCPWRAMFANGFANEPRIARRWESGIAMLRRFPPPWTVEAIPSGSSS